MAEGSSLINLGDLSKPATVLIEKVAGAVGVIFEPRRITRTAEAEAQAALIRAKGSIELDELRLRALDRFVDQESRKQANIEQITAQAAISLEENANVEQLEEDWVAHFFKNCETVSDAQMQSLWARMLAEEASTPGTFSKRTVGFVESLDKKDAELFTCFCQFVWVIGDLVPLVFDPQNEIYTKKDITFSALKHLDYMGLVSFESFTGYSRKGLPKFVTPHYFGKPTLIEFGAEKDNRLPIGHVLLTRAGQELAPICGAARNPEFHEFVIGHWLNEGLIVANPIPGKSERPLSGD